MDIVAQRIEETIEVKRKLAEACGAQIKAAGEMIADALASGGAVYAFGNGGSAADAQHFVAELVGHFTSKKRKPLKAASLSTDTSVLTSIANDYSFEDIFKRQLEGLLEPRDVVVAISTSGTSGNVVAAAEYARQKGAKVVALLGEKATALSENADIAIRVPSDRTQLIQESHSTSLHIICELIEQKFVG